MDYILPSITAIALALFVVVFIFPKLAPIILAFFAATALAYGIYNHYMMFGSEYMTMTWVDGARKAGPYIMVGTVLAFIIGYLLYMTGSGKYATAPNIPALPSAKSATNPITQGIGSLMRSNNVRNAYSPRV